MRPGLRLTRDAAGQFAVLVPADDVGAGHLIGLDLMELFVMLVELRGARLGDGSVQWTFHATPLLQGTTAASVPAGADA